MPNIFPLSTECFESRFSVYFIHGSNITSGINYWSKCRTCRILLNNTFEWRKPFDRMSRTKYKHEYIHADNTIRIVIFLFYFLKVDVDSIIKWNVNRSTTDFINGNQPCKSFNEPQNDDQNKWCKTFALSVNQVHRLNLISWLLHLLFVYLFLLIIFFFQT